MLNPAGSTSIILFGSIPSRESPSRNSNRTQMPGIFGRARNVRTERNSTDSEPLARCLETRVKEWQFPRPVGGDFELIYPFVFAPGS